MRPRLLVGAALVVAALAAVGGARADELPYTTAPPFLAGPEQQGLALVMTVAAGGWGGKHLTFTYAWSRCDTSGQSCSPIPGATTTTQLPSDEYVETAADAGHTLSVLVTATNSVGSTSRTSNRSSVLPPVGLPLRPDQYGRLEHFRIYSPALGRSQPVDLYLPPGYSSRSRQQDPVLYLLHGYPGSPSSFEDSLAVGATEEQLLAEGQMQPLVLVIPYGLPDPATEPSWLDSPSTGRWETFVTSDVTRWVDGCFNVNTSQSGRGVAGLSDGGFGALNMGIHHPAEFRLVESWSGYEHADPTEPALTGASPELLQYNSPADQLPRAAAVLRRHHVDFWIYVGEDDTGKTENEAFAAQLAAARITHTFFLVPGSHLPRVYRANLPAALREATRELTTRQTTKTRPPAPAACPTPLPPAP